MKKILLSLFLLAGGVAAQTYTVGVEQLDYFPHYASKGGSDYSGFGRDVLDAFAKSKAIHLSIDLFRLKDFMMPLLRNKLI